MARHPTQSAVLGWEICHRAVQFPLQPHSTDGGRVEPSIALTGLLERSMYWPLSVAIRVRSMTALILRVIPGRTTNVPAACPSIPSIHRPNRVSGDVTPISHLFRSYRPGYTTFFTDETGATYLPSQGGGFRPEWTTKHGAGPYHAPLIATPVYPTPLLLFRMSRLRSVPER